MKRLDGVFVAWFPVHDEDATVDALAAEVDWCEFVSMAYEQGCTPAGPLSFRVGEGHADVAPSPTGLYLIAACPARRLEVAA